MYYLQLQIHLATLRSRCLALVMSGSVLDTAREAMNYVQWVIYSSQDVVLKLAPRGQYILRRGDVELWKCDK